MATLVAPRDIAPLVDAGAALLDVQYVLGGPASRSLYAAGHLPGAQHVELDTALAAPPSAQGRHPLPEPAVLEQALRDAGVWAGQPVVVYDQQTSLAASRAWWVLRWAGIADVRVLDGGMAAWVRAGGVPTTEVQVAEHGDVVVRGQLMPRITVDQAQLWATAGRLLDVRAPERFRGEVEPIDPVAGHIPDARNLPVAELLNEDGTFRSAAEIRGIVEGLGLAGIEPVAAMCGSGVTAAQLVLALDLVGVQGVLYPGSWSEWITDPSRPVARGA